MIKERLGKRKLHKIFVVFMVLILIVLAMDLRGLPSVRAASEGEFTYTENDDGTATLTGYYGMDRDLVIPSTLKGLTVTDIADTLLLMHKVDSVVIPDSVIRIGHHAFYDQNLTYVELPSSLESLGLRAFGANPSLDKITVAVGNLTYKDIDGKGVYTLDGESLVQGTNSGIIAAGTKEIGKYAFEGMNLSDINIPIGVESIGDYAFRNNKLIEIMLPSSVKEVGSTAFELNLLTKVTLSESLERMSNMAFRHNPLEQITIPAHNQMYKDIDGKGLYTIDGNTLIQGTLSGDIQDGTKTIGNSAFSGIGLTEVIFPNSLERIELHAFRSNSLEQIIIPDNVKFIAGYAFSGNNELRDVTILGNPVIESDTVFSKVSGLEIKGYSETSVESYADRNEINFTGGNKHIEVIFNPIGSEEEIGIISVEVKVENYDEDEELKYIWSQERIVPEDNAAWISFTNGAVLDNPELTEDWYLHVWAKGLLGNDVTRRSDSLKVVFAGGYGTKEHPYEIETAEQLDAIRNYLDKYFVLIDDIDLTDFLIDEEEGWESIGSDIYAGPFKGFFDGNGHVITNLFINRNTSNQGLFSSNEGVIVNVGLTGINVSGNGSVGGLAGINIAGGIIENSYAAMATNGNENSGVMKGNSIGVLVGQNDGTINNSYARGDLIAVGAYVGILAGINSGTITNAYARGNLDGTSASIVGGLVGDNSLAGTITNTYTTGNVSGLESHVGALLGVNSNRVNNVSKSYWNNTVNSKGIGGMGLTDGATGLSTQQMKTLSSFEEFEDRDNTWTILEGVDFPYLKHHAELTLTEPEEIRMNLLQSAVVKLSGEITNADPLQPFKLHIVLSKESDDETAVIAEATFAERIMTGTFTDLELPELIQEKLEEEGIGQCTLWIFATYAAQGTAAIPLDLTIEPNVSPEAPELQTAIAGDEQVKLAWTDVSDADSYHVYQYVGDAAPIDSIHWIKIEEALTDTFYNIAGLTNGTAYTFAVTAVRDGTESGFSNSLSTTPQAPPSDNAQLSMIYIDSEELAGFEKEGSSYTISVPYQSNQVTVTAAVYDPGASYVIMNNGSVVTDGKIDLENGSNMIEIIVTAGSGDDQSTYTLTINRAESIPVWPANSEPSIEEITQTSMKLSWPAAEDEQGVTGYRIDVDEGSGSQELITVDGNVREQLITDLIPGTAYTFTINAFNAAGNESGGLEVSASTLPSLSSDAQLSMIYIDSEELAGFEKEGSSYTISVPYQSNQVTVTAAVYDPGASYVIMNNGSVVTDGKIDLETGSNTIEFIVTAESGDDQSTYTLTINRAESIPVWPVNSEPSIEEITQTSMKLSWPAAEDEQGVTGYRIDADDGSGSQELITVDGNVREQLITDLLPDMTYKFTVTAFNAAGNESEGLVISATTLPPSKNIGNSQYYIQSSNARLSELTLSAGELKPVLLRNLTEYTVEVEHRVKSLSVTPQTEHVLATVTVNGTAVTSGQASPFIDLIEGENEIVVLVTAENGTKQEYIITITRAYASNPLESKKMCRQVDEVHRFIDLDGHWAASMIQKAVCEDIVKGYPDGTFKPNDSITRAEFTVMLSNALIWEESGAKLVFTDQGQIQQWAKHAIAQAVQLGIISGYADGSVKPDAPITRAEMAMMIARSLSLSIEASTATLFDDDVDIPIWAKGAVEAIHRLGIASGRGDNSFVPNATATRAEAVVMLLRMLNRL